MPVTVAAGLGVLLLVFAGARSRRPGRASRGELARLTMGWAAAMALPVAAGSGACALALLVVAAPVSPSLPLALAGPVAVVRSASWPCGGAHRNRRPPWHVAGQVPYRREFSRNAHPAQRRAPLEPPSGRRPGPARRFRPVDRHVEPNAEPAAMSDIWRSKEPLRSRLDEHGLDAFGSGAPEAEHVIVVMVGIGDERLLAANEPCRLAVTDPLRRLGQVQADRPQPRQRVVAHGTVGRCDGSRKRVPIVSSSSPTPRIMRSCARRSHRRSRGRTVRRSGRSTTPCPR